jgi:hypothetical protein
LREDSACALPAARLFLRRSLRATPSLDIH